MPVAPLRGVAWTGTLQLFDMAASGRFYYGAPGSIEAGDCALYHLSGGTVTEITPLDTVPEFEPAGSAIVKAPFLASETDADEFILIIHDATEPPAFADRSYSQRTV